MEIRRAGESGLSLTRLGLGTMTWGRDTDEIEAAESRYWECRLTRQAFEDMVSVQTGINQGNVRANIQAGTSMASNFLDIKNKMLTNFINPQTTYILK